MRRKSLAVIWFFVTSGLGLHQAEARKLNIVTTLPSLASITQSIGGDYVDVYSITRGVQDAHYVEAKPSYMVRMNRADLLIYSGLELEIGWLPLLIQGARNDRLAVGSPGNLNAAMALSEEEVLERPRGEVDRSMGDVHPLGNPHYLLNPRNGIRAAELIAERLVQLDPEHKIQFEQNLDRFRKMMEEKIALFERQTANLKGREVVCYHVHWSYLLQWLGIRTSGYIELRPGIPPTPRHKREIIQLMQQRGVKVVIVSSWKEPTRAQEVANAVGASLLVLPGEVNATPGADDYLTWIDYLVTYLSNAFSHD